MILFCQCDHGEVVPMATAWAVRRFLEASGLPCEFVEDLCGLAARGDPRLGRLSQEDSLVIACHQRAVRWLLQAAGLGAAAGSVRVVDMRQRGPEEIIAELAKRQAAAATAGQGNVPAPVQAASRAPVQAAKPASVPRAIAAPAQAAAQAPRDAGASAADGGIPDDWVPWFPVVDYDRCADCMQCRDFCLFGVYDEGPDGRVRVAYPARCKTNCPACARLCPQVAIMFPKFTEGPIGGEEVRPEDLGRTDLRMDLSIFRRGDALAALRRRARDA